MRTQVRILTRRGKGVKVLYQSGRWVNEFGFYVLSLHKKEKKNEGCIFESS